MDTDKDLEDLSRTLGQTLLARGMMLVTAESCTGGWIAKAVTDIPGSSAWLDRGYVAYSNDAKQDVLGVEPATLEEHGAVSEPVVREMALGALAHSSAEVAVAVSGIAGPGGGTPDKPVGTVCLAWAILGRDVAVRRERFEGGREAVRRQTVQLALGCLYDWLGEDA